MSSKYDVLKEDSNVFVGEKFADQYAAHVITENGAVIIQGLPACPECGKILICKYVTEEWHCSGCGTEWNKYSLIEALQNERAVALLYKEIEE